MFKEFEKFKGFKVLKFFILNPSIDISINKFAKELKISTMTAKYYCDILEKEGFLMRSKAGTSMLFKLEDSALLRAWKRAFFLQLLCEAGLEKAINNPFYVYGSIAKGTYNERSDIDIFIIIIKEINNEEIKQIEKKIGRRLSIVSVPFYKLEEYKSRNAELVEQVKKYGVHFGDESAEL